MHVNISEGNFGTNDYNVLGRETSKWGGLVQIFCSFKDKINFTFKIQSYIIFNLDTSLIKEKNINYQSEGYNYFGAEHH